MLSKNQSYEVLKGSSQVLECRVENLGKFVVLWRKGDRILSAGRLLIRKDGKVMITEKYELKLSDIEESDAGEYVCEVDVFGETKEVRHQMIVLGKCGSLHELLINHHTMFHGELVNTNQLETNINYFGVWISVTNIIFHPSISISLVGNAIFSFYL